MDYTLSSGETIELRDRSVITERQNRPVERAYTRARPVAKKLEDAGFDPEDDKTWDVIQGLSDAELDDLDAYKAAVIAAMVAKCSFSDGLTVDSALDLPASIFEELANVCNLAYRGEPIEVNPDPLASGDDSTA